MSVNSKGTVADRLADGPDVDAVATEASRRLHRPEPSNLHSLASSLYISERQLRRTARVAQTVGLAEP
jgi:hypothetical protein